MPGRTLVNVPVDSDGLVRAIAVPAARRQVTPSMAAVLAGRFDGSAEHFLIDFALRARACRSFPTSMCCAANLNIGRSEGQEGHRRGTALELGDRFGTPNGAVISGPVLQAIAAESILQVRDLRLTSAG